MARCEERQTKPGKIIMMGYQGKIPSLGEGVFIAPGARVIGAVRLGRDSSVFYNSVIRGDVNEITVGSRTNIQDNCTLHVTSTHRLSVGDGVTVGHNVVLHGCTVGDNVLVGMGAVVLDGVVIEEDSIVAAGSLVPPGKHYPAGSMIMGSPATAVRPVRDGEKEQIRAAAASYLTTKENHLAELSSDPELSRSDRPGPG